VASPSERASHSPDRSTGLFFCLLIDLWLLNEMEEGVWACYALTKICANSQRSWLKIEQWQLNDAFHVVFAAGRR
jgi:hypothetical protein